MKKNVDISLFGVIGSEFCVASDDGQKIYERIAAALHRNRTVSLSFRNVSVLTGAFLNTAIGQLCGEFDEKRIRKLLKVKDIEPDDVDPTFRTKWFAISRIYLVTNNQFCFRGIRLSQ